MILLGAQDFSQLPERTFGIAHPAKGQRRALGAALKSRFQAGIPALRCGTADLHRWAE